MTYDSKRIKENKQSYIDWAKNLAKDIEGKPEEPKQNNLFPASSDGDIATIKDLVGNFLALLIASTAEIR